MPRTRHVAWLLALILALPSAAFGQGAGDDQYQDPFGDDPTAQQDGGSGGGDSLSDEPPGGGSTGSGSSGSGSTGGGSSGGGSTGGGSGTSPGATVNPSGAADSGLPRTGSDPRPLFLVGVAFLLLGVGLRLRTIDPDAF